MGRMLTVAAAIVGLAVAISTLPAATAQDAGACGVTTLDGVVADLNGDGILECAPGEELVVREDLAAASAGRADTRAALTSFVTLADIQLADEESPLRAEWADKCGTHPARSAFRPQETLVPHLMNSHVLAANRIVEDGSPVLGTTVDFAAALGDLADNQQFNETRWVIDLMDGAQLVDPDSGDDGYDGVQADDPDGRGDIASPVEGEGVLELANEPFWATGLRRQDGSALPWYSIQGNHDNKVQGTVPDDNPAWRAFARAWAVGAVKFQDLAPDRQQEACAGGFSDPAFWMSIAADPTAGTTQVVPADPDRRLLDKAGWMQEHFSTAGTPEGHGFGAERCTDPSGDTLSRTCYAFSDGPFRYIAIDTNPAEGLHTGNIDPEQFAWIERELIASSTRYFDAEGQEVSNPDADDRLIVTMAHHPVRSTDNTGTVPGTSDAKTGEDLTALLLRFPNVILQVSGHTHENRVLAFADEERGTGYWEVNTAAITDWPHQSRTIEIADNGDGTLSIFAVVFDAAVLPDARRIDWVAGDGTDEVALAAAERRINEQWLAAVGWETGFHDPQVDKPQAQGAPQDRNVELLLGTPFDLSPQVAGVQQGAGPSLPATGGGAWPLSLGILLLAAAVAVRRTG